ncbi:helix-turn-helix domain-containing protein [Paraburkholderia sp. USG1]|uniref:XRE family transcriptional regulator n=1 Tax=Paraburkholderia sp. USG1 TaxID=2952268 RepID=UPI0028673BE5|nr:XRE family transcriptional regulator [Paraburkholderia sp. USG1]MDR8398421.1 helix-turn-helix domain-containing protein [Paraburkholderia sp. USG1]
MAQRIKCSLRAYANYERGERVIPVELVRALYEQCSIDPIWLLTGEGTMIVDRDVRYRLDQRVLDSAVAAAERIEQHLGQPLKTRRKARLIGLLYEQSQLISQTENDLPDDSRLHRLLK